MPRCVCEMSYISVAEEEGGEPVELPTEEDGTGGRTNCNRQKLGIRSFSSGSKCILKVENVL